MSASDAPVREPGTRARSGNAMARTRAALLDATGECLGRYGIRKTTMVDVAARSRVAKATLYNHFRTKDDLLVAYVDERVASLVGAAVATAAATGLAAALTEVAGTLATDPVLRRAAAEEPALLAPLARPGSGRGWQLARTGAADVLVAARVTAEAGSIELVLRWVASQLLWPVEYGTGVEVLVRAFSVAPAVEAQPPVDAAADTAPLLGWPLA